MFLAWVPVTIYGWCIFHTGKHLVSQRCEVTQLKWNESKISSHRFQCCRVSRHVSVYVTGLKKRRGSRPVKKGCTCSTPCITGCITGVSHCGYLYFTFLFMTFHLHISSLHLLLANNQEWWLNRSFPAIVQDFCFYISSVVWPDPQQMAAWPR